MNSPICLETPGARENLGAVAHLATFGWRTTLPPRSLPGPQVGEWTEGCNS